MSGTASAGARVLILEDELIVALDIRHHVERAGHSVVATLTRGEDAIEWVSERAAEGRPADLALMDIRLAGDMDGVEAAAIVRERFAIPVILLTAYADEETIARATRSQPYAYLIKPFDERELTMAIALALLRDRANREERRRNALMSAVLLSLPVGLVVTDSGLEVLLTNEEASLALGRRVAAGMNLAEVLPSFIIDSAPASRDPVRFQYATDEGVTRTVVVRALRAEAPDAADDVQLVWSFEDVTDRLEREQTLRKQEEQLEIARRMDLVGRLAGGLAHDFNNVVTVVLGYARLILEDSENEPSLAPVAANARGIYDISQRAAALSRRLLRLTRVERPVNRQINPDEAIRTSGPLFEGALPESVHVTYDLNASETVVTADPAQLEQALLNLILNARDAMPNGGTVTITTEQIVTARPLALVNRTIEPGIYAAIRVGDSGRGIEPEHLPRVFDPLFTTKPAAEGSGIGLATVYNLIDELGGAIELSSTVGHGTEVTLYFPAGIGGETPEVIAPEREQLRGIGRGEQVLVIQENVGVRELVVTALREAGFAPVAARTVGDGVLMLERTIRVSAVVTDLSAPNYTSREVIERLRRAASGPAPVVLTTSEPLSEAPGDSTVLLKPFEPGEVVHAVRSAIDSRPA